MAKPSLTGGERMHIPGSDSSEMRDSRRGLARLGTAGGSIGRECCTAQAVHAVEKQRCLTALPQTPPKRASCRTSVLPMSARPSKSSHCRHLWAAARKVCLPLQ